jgi:hypothetical protein
MFLILFGLFEKDVYVKIHPESKITIHGRSNVNRFSCEYKGNLSQDFKLNLIKRPTKIEIQGGRISLNSNGFDCHHRMITKDLKTTINSEKYNHIDIEVKNVYYKGDEVISNIQIELSGVKKTYDVPVIITNNNVRGVLKIDIRDFNLKAPKKVLGMVVLDNNIEIEISLKYSQVA